MKKLYKKFLQMFFNDDRKEEVTFFDLSSRDKKRLIKGAVRYANRDQRELVERVKRRMQPHVQKS